MCTPKDGDWHMRKLKKIQACKAKSGNSQDDFASRVCIFSLFSHRLVVDRQYHYHWVAINSIIHCENTGRNSKMENEFLQNLYHLSRLFDLYARIGHESWHSRTCSKLHFITFMDIC